MRWNGERLMIGAEARRLRPMRCLHLASIEHEYVDTPSGEILNVRHCRLPLSTRESILNGGEIVILQDRNEVVPRRSARSSYGTLADLIFSQTRYFLCKRHMPFEVMFVKRGRILRCFVHH